jgi:hypothetical protein
VCHDVLAQRTTLAGSTACTLVRDEQHGDREAAHELGAGSACEAYVSLHFFGAEAHARAKG